jgi:hypothetical protein
MSGERTVTRWASDELASSLDGLALADGVQVDWSDAAWVSGEVTVQERKGKPVPIYSLEAEVPWTGTVDGKQCSGTVRLPDISLEMLDDLEVTPSSAAAARRGWGSQAWPCARGPRFARVRTALRQRLAAPPRAAGPAQPRRPPLSSRSGAPAAAQRREQLSSSRLCARPRGSTRAPARVQVTVTGSAGSEAAAASIKAAVRARPAPGRARAGAAVSLRALTRAAV